MNDKNIKFEFKIKLLHICQEPNDNSIYTISIYKIYSIIYYKTEKKKLLSLQEDKG